MRRRRISIALVIALAAAIGLFAGTKLPRRSATKPIDLAEQRHEAIGILSDGSCSTPDRARMLLAYYDVGHDQLAYDVRLLCVIRSKGIARLADELRALEPELRIRIINHIGRYGLRMRADVADALFDVAPERTPDLDAAAHYNLARGNRERALLQLRTFVGFYERHLSAENFDDRYLLSRQLIVALEAWATQPGRSYPLPD